MTAKTYDVKCLDLAKAFLSDEPGITPNDLHNHAHALAGEIQERIEDYIRFEFRPNDLPPTVIPIITPLLKR